MSFLPTRKESESVQASFLTKGGGVKKRQRGRTLCMSNLEVFSASSMLDATVVSFSTCYS